MSKSESEILKDLTDSVIPFLLQVNKNAGWF